MVPTVDCPPHTVRVFDSLNLQLSSSLIKVIADMMHTTSSTIGVDYADMHYQAGGGDCGLFAIASA